MTAKIVDEFNGSICAGTIPQTWLHSYLVPLPKQSGDGSRLEGYRIITLQNVYSKLAEKIIARRLSNILEQEGLLPDTHGGYRPGHDTVSNAAVLVFDVYEGFQRKEESAIVALDLEDAYNTVDYIIHNAGKNSGDEVWSADIRTKKDSFWSSTGIPTSPRSFSMPTGKWARTHPDVC